MRGVAARYPAWDNVLARPVNLGTRINLCRQRHQGQNPWPAEHQDLLALEVLVGHQSRGLPVAPPSDARLQPFRERGAQLFAQRIGQLDLSSVRTLLAAIDDDRLSLAQLFGVLHDVLRHDDPPDEPSAARERAGLDVDDLIGRLGWEFDRITPGHRYLIRVLATMRCLGCDSGMDVFVPYAEAADRLARCELEILAQEGAVVAMGAAIGIVRGGAA